MKVLVRILALVLLGLVVRALPAIPNEMPTMGVCAIADSRD